MDPNENVANTSTTGGPNPAEEEEDQPMIDAPDDNSNLDDDDDDEGPQFVTAGEDAIEVPVDDDNVPMEDDDDDFDDDENLAVAHQDETNPTTETPTPDQSQWQIRAHTDSVYAISAAVAPAASASSSPAAAPPQQQLLIVSGGGDDRAFCHTIPLFTGNSATISSIQLSHSHTDSVAATALNWTCPQYNASTTPAVLAVAGFDGAIVLYHVVVTAATAAGAADVVSLSTPTLLEGPSDVEWLRFHPTGTVLLAGSATDGTVWMYNTTTVQGGTCLQVFVGHEAAVTAGDFTPNGKLAVTASADGTVRVWAPKTGLTKHVFRFLQHSNNNDAAAAVGLTCLQVGGGADGKLLLVGTEDGQAHLCHTGTKKVVASWRHSPAPTPEQSYDDDDDEPRACSVEAVGFCPSNPHWCATAGVDGTLKIWDLTNHQCRHMCRHNGNGAEGVVGVTRLQWLPDVPVVVTITTVGTVHLWDARSGMPLLPEPLTTGSNATLNDLQVLPQPDGTVMIVTAGDDHVVRVFQVNVHQLLQQPHQPQQPPPRPQQRSE